MRKIRNFCIIAHIDHGKSTLADRMLEMTGTIEKRKMRKQVLDQMDLEQERGITIKLQPVTMKYGDYILNLIDTPGHVDFTYEVSRSLAACEGAILLVDATQGIQAQTLANLYLALEQDLAIIPVVNKIDLPAADFDSVSREIVNLLGCEKEEILKVSAKTGEGVADVFSAIISFVPEPKQMEEKSFQALIFDSKFDDYKGVVAYVRVVEGTLKKNEDLFLLGTAADAESLEVGIFKPEMKAESELRAGDIGYIVTGLKEVASCRVGDTIVKTSENKKRPVTPLAGYAEVKPMVFAGVFCKEGSEYPQLRDAMEKLKLNDASLSFEPENSKALGFGFRCGFLGLLHLEIVQERLHREYHLDLIVTAPSVAYQMYLRNSPNEPRILKSPQDFPDPAQIDHIEEPMMKVDIVTPASYLGNMMTLTQSKRGEYHTTEYLNENSAILHYTMPMSSILTDFYDKLKSVSSGYASLNYEFCGYQKADVVRMDILVATEPIEALSIITYKDSAYDDGKVIVAKLKNILPKQMFEVKIQAAVGAKIVASEKISAMRKDVTAKLYGGDVTRKRKLLEKQKKGKRKMKSIGKVDIPPEAFIAILKKE
ncbi:MAG TPA: translation elongation factor 4 [Patescibacteria group bacterium]|nr:translation elongation factor 4 [Patescibacteria group bacterium]